MLPASMIFIVLFPLSLKRLPPTATAALIKLLPSNCRSSSSTDHHQHKETHLPIQSSSFRSSPINIITYLEEISLELLRNILQEDHAVAVAQRKHLATKRTGVNIPDATLNSFAIHEFLLHVSVTALMIISRSIDRYGMTIPQKQQQHWHDHCRPLEKLPLKSRKFMLLMITWHGGLCGPTLLLLIRSPPDCGV